MSNDNLTHQTYSQCVHSWSGVEVHSCPKRNFYSCPRQTSSSANTKQTDVRKHVRRNTSPIECAFNKRLVCRHKQKTWYYDANMSKAIKCRCSLIINDQKCRWTRIAWAFSIRRQYLWRSEAWRSAAEGWKHEIWGCNEWQGKNNKEFNHVPRGLFISAGSNTLS